VSLKEESDDDEEEFDKPKKHEKSSKKSKKKREREEEEHAETRMCTITPHCAKKAKRSTHKGPSKLIGVQELINDYSRAVENVAFEYGRILSLPETQARFAQTDRLGIDSKKIEADIWTRVLGRFNLPQGTGEIWMDAMNRLGTISDSPAFRLTRLNNIMFNIHATGADLVNCARFTCLGQSQLVTVRELVNRFRSTNGGVCDCVALYALSGS
jgi:hypothetical protein